LPTSDTRPSESHGDDAVDTVRVDMQVDGVAMVQLLGPQDRLLKAVEKQYPDVRVLVRGNEVVLEGPSAAVRRARGLVDELVSMVRGGHDLAPAEVETSARVLDAGQSTPSAMFGDPIVSGRGKAIRAKTPGQREYVDAIDENTITFGIGPAGTGKTYLAMAKAVQALQRREVQRIILTRPAVEAGERLGFLPGTLTDKIDPYLRPLYDALNEMMDPEIVPKLLAAGTVEVAPLAYGSKMVVTGDVTQIDLPTGASGLQLVTRVLGEIDDIHFSRLTSDDVVRHTLVGRIVDAYTTFDAERQAQQFARSEAAGAARADQPPRGTR
jgi:phosphate starvation-inducible PhoH-like protein